MYVENGLGVGTHSGTGSRNRWWLIAFIVAIILIRASVVLIMPQPLVSDFKSYFEMARSFAVGGPMRDIYGSEAFYSPGYPLLLGTIFTVTGPSVTVALASNICLAALTGWLVFRLACVVTTNKLVPYIAVAFYAVWLPGMIASASLAKENLSVPLLLGFLLSILSIAGGGKASFIAGLCFGAGLLTGSSTLFVIIAFLFVLWKIRKGAGARKTAQVGGSFVMAVALVLGPWLFHTYHLFGRPLLTTNSGFNLYIGNNPAATGSFVSIADTPVGPMWHSMRDRLGEAGSADALREMAVQYALANPERTAELTVIKLLRFWTPNVPQSVGNRGRLDGLGRWLDIVQYVLLLSLATFGGWIHRKQAHFMVLGLTIISFWAIHAAPVVMYRYRDPIMPIVIVFAALGLVALFGRKSAFAAGGAAPHTDVV